VEKSKLKLVVKTLSPYMSENVKIVANEFRKENVDIIVLDCIGYGKEIARIIKEATNKPVLLPRTLLARIIRELCE